MVTLAEALERYVLSMGMPERPVEPIEPSCSSLDVVVGIPDADRCNAKMARAWVGKATICDDHSKRPFLYVKDGDAHHDTF